MYSHKEIEKKWQDYWDKNKTFKSYNPGDKESFNKPKYYVLDMFPYPSGAWLHVGHPEWYTANDIIARYKKAKWYNVLHPMGWDAFWLPAENYAIKTWTHPRVTTDKNIATFKKQIKSLWISYDWDREIDTTNPEYYKWTQWIFLKMFEHWLAYEQDLPINYCPSCKTGLANEEVLNDFTCERCHTKVEKKKIRQWVLAITKYADRLLKDVDKLDWPESIKEMQRNWIWKSEGCEFEMKVAQKKWESPTPQGGGHNVLARISFESIILENIEKVKKKKKKIRISLFKSILKGKNDIWNIDINWNFLYNHFIKKSKKEALLRISLFQTIIKSIENISFTNNIWYIIVNNFIIKIILWTNEKWLYLKTYYISNKFTKLYQEYLQELEKNTPKISVYTTRIDTVFGMTYAVIAPDHKDVEKFITPEQKEVCQKYIEDSAKKSDQDRIADNKEKTWVFTGSYVINPFNWKEVPLWIADYVLGNYWTWAVMAVPAHDTRDFEFAKKYNLEIKQSIAPIFEWWSEWKWMPKKDKKTLKTNWVWVLMENQEWQIWILEWKNDNWKTFISWWIEKWEKAIEWAKREVKEETWYYDLSKKWSFIIISKNYHPPKDINFDATAYCFYFKLNSLKKEEVDIKELKKHIFKWYEKKEIKKILSFNSNKYIFEQFLEKQTAFTDLWILVNSWEFSWLESKQAQEKLIEYATRKWFWKKKVNYKLRDWLFSRQRYWGEPIPLIHLEKENLKKLPHIDEKAFVELQNEVENLINKKMKVVPLSKKEWGTHNGTTTKPSLIDSIFKNTQKVKKKRQKSFKFKEVFEEKLIWNKKIKISWAYLIWHFKLKTRKEFLERIHFAQTITDNLEKVYFINDTLWILNISWKYWIIILDKYSDWSYHLLTYYNFYSLNKKLNKAYILKREPKAWENVTWAVCHHSWMVRELVIGWKVFSKIYDGIYGKIVCDYRLPLELPEVKDFAPAGDWQSPLAKVEDFVNVKLAENLVWKRETNTMPQWWGSCWYYLRYMDPKNSEKLVDPEIEKYWGQVDSYVGWAEHAVLHLLYARFWHKFLFDIGVVSSDEPFYRLRNQWLIQSYVYETDKWEVIHNDLVEEKDWQYFHKETWEELIQKIWKMSKSLGNVINPDDIVEEYWADSLRLYEMYMAEFKDSAPWDTKNIIWVRRFLEKTERAFSEQNAKIAENDDEAIKLLNKTIKKVWEDIENYKFNTAIASMMILVNYWKPESKEKFEEWKEKFAIILSPFAPHLAEELWQENLWNKESIFNASWPEYDEKLVVDDTIKIAVQVLWKLRWTIEISKDEAKDSVLEKAKNNSDVAKWLEGKNIVKEIYVPGKIVNLVVK